MSSSSKDQGKPGKESVLAPHVVTLEENVAKYKLMMTDLNDF